MHFTECVPAGDQRHGFFIIHRHAGEGFAHILCAQQRVGIAVGTLRVDINQTHLNGSQRIFQRLSRFGITVIIEPTGFGTPINIFFRMPNIGAAAAKTECFATHGFDRDIASEHKQVGPANGIAIFLFHRPQQTTCFVQIAIIRPAVKRRKALCAGSGTAATISCTVSAGCVPCHTDEKRAVVTIIGRPPVLRVCHQRGQIFFQRFEIQFFERLAIVVVALIRV